MTIETVLSKQQLTHRRWQFAQLLFFLCVISALYFPSVALLFARWTQWDQDLSHGLPTILVFLFLIWRSSPWSYRADSTYIRISLIVLLTFTSIAWCLFDKMSIFLLAYLSLLSIVVLFIASCYSKKTALHLIIPCGILIFAIPLWGYLNGPLVELSAYVVGVLARFAGLTLLMDGNNIFIPYGRLYIDDGCSGLRYFVIALLMAYLISHLSHYRFKHVLVAFALAIVLALFINWIRIFLLVVIGYQTEMKSSLMEDHELFGWILFAVVMLPAIYFAPAFPPVDVEDSDELRAKPILPLGALAVGPVISFFVGATLSTAPSFNLSALDPLETSISPHAFLAMDFPGEPVTHSKLVMVENVTSRVELAQYTQVSAREKLVPYFRSLYDRDNWSVANEIEHDESKISFSVLKRAGSEQYQLLAHLYHVGRFPTGRYEFAKLLQIPAMFLGDSYFTILTAQTACTDSTCHKEIESLRKVVIMWKNDPK